MYYAEEYSTYLELDVKTRVEKCHDMSARRRPLNGSQLEI